MSEAHRMRLSSLTLNTFRVISFQSVNSLFQISYTYLVTCFFSLVTSTCHLLFATCYLPLVTCLLLLATCHLYHLLTTKILFLSSPSTSLTGFLSFISCFIRVSACSILTPFFGELSITLFLSITINT